MADQEWADYLAEALKILAGGLERYRAGHEECYRVLAAQLRLLLCDTARIHGRIVDISLVRRVWPEASFHPLQAGAGPQAEIRFDRRSSRLPLRDWLAQEIPSGPPDGPIRLRDLIRLVTDQDGGAHVDPKPHSPIRRRMTRAVEIASLAEYVLSELSPEPP